MKTIETTAPESTAVMELDLMPYINALIDARWILIIAALLSAVLAGFQRRGIEAGSRWRADLSLCE